MNFFFKEKFLKGKNWQELDSSVDLEKHWDTVQVLITILPLNYPVPQFPHL